MFDSLGDRNRPNWKLRAVLAALVLAMVWGCIWLLRVTQMPLKSYMGPLPPISLEQSDLAERLSAHVKYLSATIGDRSMPRAGSLKATIDYIRSELTQAGYAVDEHTFSVHDQQVSNIEADLLGSETAEGSVIVGAHYDSVTGTVGANDNCTGVAAVLELAKLLKTLKLRRTLRFVLFVNEEPPYFQSENMGSLAYARQLRREGIPVSGMISLETIGFYSDAPGSQKYPPLLNLFYPSRGDFIGFVGNEESRDLVRRSIRTFRETTSFPSEGIAAPSAWPGIGWSDHWSFWQENHPAIMITDTAPFRYPYYHTPRDTFDKVNFEKTARVVEGVRHVIEFLSDER
jgi:Zn-dependent M28 family amino/carboxypeptidase